MANPHEPHFLKPLLPGFHNGVTIPLSFFSQYIQGKTNGKKWKLRSDTSDQTWEVIQEGRRLTGGWKDFTTAHDLQIGDTTPLMCVCPERKECSELLIKHLSRMNGDIASSSRVI
ncbi:B3 domain-containing protein REM6-like [Brassica napus]|uniref:B3 domain-containing protein REM6-like n=1 Tax=Brassica napus TaxID=3708 RepID=UPI00207871AA|nr:B3 domain-containing protein REM6-like [Brassica napus]